MSSKHKNLLGWFTAAGLVTSTAYAATNVVDFNTSGSLPYVEIGTSAAEYRADGGASGANGDGYLSVTDARGGQRSSVLFNDLDNGLVVKAFTFECDLRIGGGTGQPADGFSVNYIRATDPIAQSGGPYAGTEGEADLPEEGTLTGLGIGFDTWQSGNHPGGITDVVGLSIRVDGTLITQLPVPLRPGNVWPGGTYDEVPYRNLATNNVNYANSMQTGALSDVDLNGDEVVNGDDANAPQPLYADDPVQWFKWIKNLKWEKFKAELDEQGKVKIYWKGVELTPSGGLTTAFAPSPGRIVFGARTGGAWEAHHVDNLRLVTVPADNIVIGQAIGNPIGFSISTIDSGSAVAVTTGLSVTLNGTAVTPTSATKDGITTTVVYNNLGSPLPVGSTNTVVLAIRDTLGRTVTETRTFITAPYVTFPAAYAVTGVNTSAGGFNVRVHQSDTRNLPTTIARAEQQLAGLHGANIADLTAANASGVFTETGVINYSQPGSDGNPEQNGFFSGVTTLPTERQIADNYIPGLPSPVDSTYTDNIAAEITTYLNFATPGVYVLTFNSDDGFRTTLAPNNAEVLTSVIVSQADVGKGASDINATVYVPTAGFYPVRTVWFEGGGGANLEWSAQRIAPDVTARYLLNDANPAAIKAYRSRTGTTPAAVSFISPARDSGNNYLPGVSLIASVQDGSTAATGIQMLLDGTAVTAQSARNGNTTTLTYAPTAPLAGGSHSLVIRFTAGDQTYSGTNTFTTATLPQVAASLALPANAVNTANRGFLVKVVQQANGESMGNDTYRGLTHVAGLIGTPNRVDPAPFTGPGGYFVESNVINYEQGGASSGFFPDDTGIPGIPGLANEDGSVTSGNGTDNFATEILTVLNLQAGTYAFNVNSDDGFVMTVGNPAEAFTLPTVVGEFSGGRGNGGGLNDGTTFYFQVAQAGLYPVRLVWYEGGGGANCEFSARQFDPVTGVIRSGNLINSDGGIVAYQYPITSAGAPYVKSFAPARSGRASTLTPYRAGTDAAVKAVIGHGVGAAPTGVTLVIDGTNSVTPTVTTAGNETTVSYKPAAGWTANSTHTAALTYSGRTVSWSFGIGALRTPTFFIEAEDFDNAGASPAATSQMPYFGGALAGATSTATDYSRPNEGSSPIYRIGENPQVPMDRTGDRDRGVNELAVNYKIGWVGADQWYQYTRTFPAGTYNVYAGMSHGDGPDSATRIGGNLATVSGGTPTVVGSFYGNATGGWGNNALLPMMDAASTNTLATVELSGSKTVRFTTQNGDYDFILFVPAASNEVVVSPTVPGIPGSAQLTNIQVNTATKTITATVPSGASAGTGFFSISPRVTITSFSYNPTTGVLTLTYQ